MKQSICRLLTFLLVTGLPFVCWPDTAVQAQEPPYLRVEAGSHNAQVRAVLFTPDGVQLITAGFDKTVRIWDARGSGTQPLRTFRYQIGDGDVGEITAAAVCPDKNLPFLALGVKGIPRDKNFPTDTLIINYVTGSVVRRMPSDGGAVTALAYSADGNLLAAGNDYGDVEVYSSADLRPDNNAGPKHRWPRVGLGDNGKHASVTGLAFAPDGMQVAAAFKQFDNTGFLQRFAFGKEKAPEKTESKTAVVCVAWSSATGTLAWGEDSGAIHLLNEAKQFDRTLNDPAIRSVTCLAFNKEGTRLFCGGGAHNGERCDVNVWSLQTRRLENQPFRRHSATVSAVAVSGDGKEAASGDITGRIYVWDPNTRRDPVALTGSGEALGQVCWSPDGKTLAWGGLNQNDPLIHAFSLVNMMPAPLPPPNANWPSYKEDFNKLVLQVEGLDPDSLYSEWRRCVRGCRAPVFVQQTAGSGPIHACLHLPGARGRGHTDGGLPGRSSVSCHGV